jgi:VanZ family protein
MSKILSFFVVHSRVTLFLAIVWTAFIFFACFLPGADVPKVNIFGIDKLVHIVLFGFCSFLWGMSLKNDRSSLAFWLWLLGACVGLGILVEIIQSTNWVHGRTGDIWDVVADTIGAVLGIWVVKFSLQYLKQRL